MRVFDFFYTLLALALFGVALPFILFLSFKKKYRSSIPARFFLYRNPPFRPQDLWFHVCSLGEAKALSPLMERLKGRNVAITTITHTGYEAASRYEAQVRYLPFEPWLWMWIRRPQKVVILEAEFWYLLFRIATLRGAKVIALNARISDRSFPKYYKMRWFYQRLFAHCDTILCQSEVDRDRFIALGARNVQVVGNIKLAQKIQTHQRYFKPQGTLIVAASTHEGEEEGIIKGFHTYKKHNPFAKLLIVPRHPERFAQVETMIRDTLHEVSFSVWSHSHNLKSDITLIDAMGELNNFYAISDVTILGGAFAPIGGHNPLEPAHFGCKIITGEHIFLQKELFKYVSSVQFVSRDGIAGALIEAETLPKSTITGTIDLDRVMGYLD